MSDDAANSSDAVFNLRLESAEDDVEKTRTRTQHDLSVWIPAKR
jgi:hypothetical protein